jgi:hypothetical protein
VGTVGDELRYATGKQSKVITVSGKDRGAILLGGKTGTAYMYMETSGNFASSTYYMKEHPQWVQRYNAARPQDKYYGARWNPLLPAAAYAGDAPPLAGTKAWLGSSLPITFTSESGKTDPEFFLRLKHGPFLDQLTVDFAKAVVAEENLGKNPAGVTDILGVSFSAHDYINHEFGPESVMSHDHLQRLDRMLADFFSYLDKRVGMDNVMVVLTADHGFPNTPEFMQARGYDAGRVNEKPLLAALDKHLAGKFALEKLVVRSSLPHVFFDYDRASRAGIKREDLEDTAARFILTQPGIANVYTRSQMERGGQADTRMGLLMRRAWHRQLGGDLMVVVKPYWYFSSNKAGTSHGTPYRYDTNVPLFIMGKQWIKPGQYGQYTEVMDLAPTLAHVLRIRPPAGAEGRVLVEALR